jgi:hypothetical protein
VPHTIGKKLISPSLFVTSSVFHAVEAVAVSHAYLKDDGYDVKFCPCFTKIIRDDGEEVRIFGPMYRIISFCCLYLRTQVSALYFGVLPRKMRGN